MNLACRMLDLVHSLHQLSKEEEVPERMAILTWKTNNRKEVPDILFSDGFILQNDELCVSALEALIKPIRDKRGMEETLKLVGSVLYK